MSPRKVETRDGGREQVYHLDGGLWRWMVRKESDWLWWIRHHQGCCCWWKREPGLFGPSRLVHRQLSLSHGQIPWLNPMAETHGQTHQLLIFGHKHKITNSKFEKKQAPRERKWKSWIWKERRKTKIQTQIEQVMDLERMKKKKYKMRVNESRLWLG